MCYNLKVNLHTDSYLTFNNQIYNNNSMYNAHVDETFV